MANFFNDNDDLKYYVDQWIDWAPIVSVTENFDRAPDRLATPEEAAEMYRDMLVLLGQFAAEEIAPYSAEIDREGVRFENGEAVFPERLQSIFDQIQELELHGMCLPRELGGQNCPMILFFIVNELIGRADTSVMASHSFYGAMAMAMLVYSLGEGTTEIDAERGILTKTRFAKEIEEIRAGKACGAMDITEPNAGSDMAQLRATGEQDENGNWLVSGQKIFITSGHGKYHFVIARTETPDDPEDAFAGLAGLSMFLVPAYEEDAAGKKTRIATIDRLEDKLGHHGSATASLTFDRAPAELIGKRGEGFKLMLTMMNNARIGVGFECLGLCEASYRIASEYAAERHSMGKPIGRHEMIADYLDEMRTDTRGIRALAVHSAVQEELALKTRVMLQQGFITDEDELEKHEATVRRCRRDARRLTPLLKYLAAEKSVEMAQRCVQILGGVGYTKDYGAEKLLRDSMVMPIYEGTSQIQALMVMKDSLTGAIKNPGRFAKRVAQCRLKAASARDPLEKRVAKLQVLSLNTQQHLLAKTAADKYRALRGKPLTEWPERFLKEWDPKRHFGYAMLHAERLTRQLADEAVCEILLEQSQRHPERRPILEAYLERAEPRARYLHQQITRTGQRLLDDLESQEQAQEQREAV